MQLLDKSGTPRYTDLMRDEISSKSVVRGNTGNIASNVQSFVFSVGSHQRWKPLLSSWVMKYQITDDGGNQIELADDIAPAINSPLNGWQYMHLYAGGQKIDEVSEHVAEVSALRTRLEKTKSWYDSVGRTLFWDTSFVQRQNLISADAPDFNDVLGLNLPPVDLQTIANIGFAVGGNVTIADGGVENQSQVTFAGATFTAADVAVGDVLLITADTHGDDNLQAVTIMSITDDTNIQVTPRLAANVATPYVAGDILIKRERQTTTQLQNFNVLPTYNKRDRLQVQFKLPLGACYLDEMPSGDYEFRLRGFSYTEFATRMVESINAGRALAADFKIQIDALYYHPYIVEATSRIEDETIVKAFKCYELQKKKLLSDNNQLQYNIKGNATALGFALQDGRVGSSTLYSPSRFRAFNDVGVTAGSQGRLGDGNRVDTDISYYQLRYANKFRPEPAQQDDLTARNIRITQSYLDTYKNSGSYYYEGCMETLEDYIERGPIYYWNWPRDKNTFATEARLDIKTRANPGSNTFCCLFFCFYREIRLTLKDGRIVSVEKNI